MSEFYDDMRDMADEVLADFAQGTVILRRVVPGTSDPATPWIPPTEDTTTDYPLSATVKRLHQRYEGGVLIVETGDHVMFAVPAVTPLITDTIVIDGAERVITNLTPVPAAGSPVMWKAWCTA